MKIREDAANFMAKFANTGHLDLDAQAYSDEENATPSGLDAEESDDSSKQQYGDSDGDDVGDAAATGSPCAGSATQPGMIFCLW